MCQACATWAVDDGDGLEHEAAHAFSWTVLSEEYIIKITNFIVCSVHYVLLSLSIAREENTCNLALLLVRAPFLGILLALALRRG